MFKVERRPTMPGEILQEHYLLPREISISAFAYAVGCSRKHMSDIVHGKVRLEAPMAAHIAKVLGTTTQFWVNLQGAVDAYDAEQETRKWKPAALYRAIDQRARLRLAKSRL